MTPNVVALGVARGDKYSSTLEDINTGEVYALSQIIRH